MKNTKQVIVVRRDIQMPTGKLAAQVAHASSAIFINSMVQSFQSHMIEWRDTGHTKICLGVDSEEELIDIHAAALHKNLPTFFVVDSGRTVFRGERTSTCVAIGPYWSDAINEITGHLRLL